MKNTCGLQLHEDGWFGIADGEWVHPAHTALLIIDMQNYDANPAWGLIGTRGTGTKNRSIDYYYTRIKEKVIPAIAELLQFFRENELLIAHLFFASRNPDASDMPPLWRLRFDQHAEDSGKSYTPFADAEEMQILDDVSPLPGEVVLSKVTGSAFASTEIHNVLCSRGIRSFLACGVWGNSCVEDTVRAGSDLGYLVTLVEDATASPDADFHNSSIRVLGEMYCQVRKSDWIIHLMSLFMKE
jgi:nicotinamidase-related amidase